LASWRFKTATILPVRMCAPVATCRTKRQTMATRQTKRQTEAA